MTRQLYEGVSPSVCPLVGPLVGWSLFGLVGAVGWSVMLSSKLMKNELLRILNDLDTALLDEEKRGTRRKEGRGGRGDEEEGGTRRKDGRGGRMDV